MDDSLQAKAYEKADFSKSDKDLIIALEEFINSKEKNQKPIKLIIDIGCGPGKITELLSARWPSSKVIGLDGARSMINIAKQRHLNYFPHLLNLSYFCIDIAGIHKSNLFNAGSADLIVSNSCLHHLHDPQILWTMSKFLAAKDCIHFHRDLRRPDSLEQATEIIINDTNTSSILRRDYLASLLAAFTVEEVKGQLQLARLASFTVKEVGDRYLQVIGSKADPEASNSAYLLNS